MPYIIFNWVALFFAPGQEARLKTTIQQEHDISFHFH